MELFEIEIEIGGGRMGANVRKGGRTALPPLHSAANVDMEGGGIMRNRNRWRPNGRECPERSKNSSAPVAFDR